MVKFHVKLDPVLVVEEAVVAVVVVVVDDTVDVEV